MKCGDCIFCLSNVHLLVHFLGYNDDDELVPKNASLVVKRIPATAKNSLLSRLANRATSHHHTVMCVYGDLDTRQIFYRNLLQCF